MKRFTAIVVLLAGLTGVAVGYLLGFRQGWRLGAIVESPVRGATSLALLHGLDTGKLDAIKTSFESDIDTGLLWWPDVERFPAYGNLTLLSGDPAFPDIITYVRRIATYRRNHPSPLLTPEITQQTLESVRKDDPALAEEMVGGGKEANARIAEMVRKYGH